VGKCPDDTQITVQSEAESSANLARNGRKNSSERGHANNQ